MLKNVRLHVEKDEIKQQTLEEELAKHITKVHKSNINAFQRQIPTLLPYLQETSTQNISVFCNKFGGYNIVDYGQGRTLYGFNPKEEVAAQVEQFRKHSPCIRLDENTDSTFSNDVPDKSDDSQTFLNSATYKSWSSNSALPEELNCLIVLGCGLGLHLLPLIEQHKIKHIIIYEPETKYFSCSALVYDWKTLLDVARAKGTALYMEIGKDGRDLIANIAELQSHFVVNEIYLYQHYKHPVFNSIYQQVTTEPWQKLKQRGISYNLQEHYLEYSSPWAAPINLTACKDVSVEEQKFKDNINAFKFYYPEIYKKFVEYKPRKWQPIYTENNEINIIKRDSLTNWYGEHPKNECTESYQGFTEQPNRDGLALGYTGTKLAHYLHYKFVKRSEKLLESEEQNGSLPENIQSIIVFGLGAGYQIETLIENHNVEHFFICEPNPDFFYASLFAIDWKNILETLDAKKSRLYMNIGDDGTNLFRDLVNQFYAIGPYILNNTYFYQGYYNAPLNNTIAQLREQLRIVICMGEYFDHAYFGIAHTREILSRQYPVLRTEPAKKLSFEDKTVPVFLIGNGPSLDHSIEVIKEAQSNAILVTCGTSLQVMQRNGITPDFHAEIEQNRSTYDWATLIDDLEYLKNISLISCNGIHPDTCELYKDLFFAFKDGESSTVSALEVIGNEKVEKLTHSFPTVANLACELFSKLGFENIYLLGIDLGFIDNKHHHSVESSYYKEDGSECYDYSDKTNTSLVIPGNFRSTVNTKHEFKISKQIIEQLLLRTNKNTTFYNCSDGAKINGALPLALDNIILTNTTQQKNNALTSVKNNAFEAFDGCEFKTQFDQKYRSDVLTTELAAIDRLLESKIETFDEAEGLIRKQKELLFHSYKRGQSLLFYYLYGTVNYANALLTKLTHFSGENEPTSPATEEALSQWKECFSQIKTMITSETKNFDVSCRYISKRETILIRKQAQDISLLIVTNSSAFSKSAEWYVQDQLGMTDNVTILSYSQASQVQGPNYDFVIYHANDQFGHCEQFSNFLSGIKLQILGRAGTTVMLPLAQKPRIRELHEQNPDVCFVPTILDNKPISDMYWSHTFFTTMKLSIFATLQDHKSQLILIKYQQMENNESELPLDALSFPTDDSGVILDFGSYRTLNFAGTRVSDSLPISGTRGSYVFDPEDIYGYVKGPQPVSEEDIAEITKSRLEAIPELALDQKLS